MRILALLCVTLFSGCLSESSAPAPDTPIVDAPVRESSPAAPENGAPPGDYWAWYPIVKAEGDQLRWFKDPDTRMSGPCCVVPGIGAMEWGPFNATARTPGFSEGTKATWTLPYNCQHPGTIRFDLTLFADGEILLKTSRNITEAAVAVGPPDTEWIEELDLPAVASGAHLGILFRQSGCGFFTWGRGGDWATRLEIERPVV